MSSFVDKLLDEFGYFDDLNEASTNVIKDIVKFIKTIVPDINDEQTEAIALYIGDKLPSFTDAYLESVNDKTNEIDILRVFELLGEYKEEIKNA